MLKLIFTSTLFSLILSLSPSLGADKQIYQLEEVERYRAFCELRDELKKQLAAALSADVSVGEAKNDPQQDQGGGDDAKGAAALTIDDLVAHGENRFVELQGLVDAKNRDQSAKASVVMYFFNKREELEWQFKELIFKAIPPDISAKFGDMGALIRGGDLVKITDPDAPVWYDFTGTGEALKHTPNEIASSSEKYKALIGENFDYCLLRGLMLLHVDKKREFDFTDFLKKIKTRNAFNSAEKLYEFALGIYDSQRGQKDTVFKLISSGNQVSVLNKKVRKYSNRALLQFRAEPKSGCLASRQTLQAQGEEEKTNNSRYAAITQGLISKTKWSDLQKIIAPTQADMLYVCFVNELFARDFEGFYNALRPTLNLLKEACDLAPKKEGEDNPRLTPDQLIPILEKKGRIKKPQVAASVNEAVGASQSKKKKKKGAKKEASSAANEVLVHVEKLDDKNEVVAASPAVVQTTDPLSDSQNTQSEEKTDQSSVVEVAAEVSVEETRLKSEEVVLPVVTVEPTVEEKLMADLQGARLKIKGLKEQLEEKTKEGDSLKKKLEKRSSKVRKLQGEIEKLEAQIREMQKGGSKNATELERIKEEKKQLQGKNSALETDLTTSQRQLTRVTSERQVFSKEAESLRRKNHRLSQQVSEADLQVIRLQSQVNEMNKTMGMTLEEIEGLKKTLAEQEADQREKTAAIQGLLARIDEEDKIQKHGHNGLLAQLDEAVRAQEQSQQSINGLSNGIGQLAFDRERMLVDLNRLLSERERMLFDIRGLMTDLSIQSAQKENLAAMIAIKEADYLKSKLINEKLIEQTHESNVGKLEAEVRRVTNRACEAEVRENEMFLENEKLRAENKKLLELLAKNGISF